MIAACNQFIYIEILSQNKIVDTAATDSKQIDNPSAKSKTIPGKTSAAATDILSAPGIKKSSKELAMDAKLVMLIRSAIDALSDDDGFAHMGEVKKHILKNYSAFDSRNYGYAKFSDLVKAVGLFEIDPQKQRIKDERKK